MFGILGGSFNPVHFGHLTCAELALEKLKLQKVLFIPAYISPFKIYNKEIYVEPEKRLKMLEFILTDKYEIIDFEIRQHEISYTINTLKYLYNHFNLNEKERSFYLIIGSDNFLAFNNWYKYNEILNLVKLAVIEREGYPIKNSIITDFEYLGKSKFNISSSQLREMIKEKKDCSEFIPERVWKFILDEKLYQ
ncbi:MAG TPA: nicotinate (nicotinamide) nucleotide adenylyltransferase [bacterium]|nr:nicotinate (nicotinamide) nucleotide adenylyltransferase [bacterium]HOL46819.1 nicotinate (nicotinamide) nucleotide adenylyltransferase [bacterium]HPQ18655.1 nicotinate (nicotinamide) nucleotide adenylyltransferase [bacterium]